MIGKRLFVLLACLFVVMIGFGITLPVLPFYVERLAQAEGATPAAIVMHVAWLTAAYPLGQLVFAPVWVPRMPPTASGRRAVRWWEARSSSGR